MKKGMKRTLLAFMVMAMLASSAAVPAMAETDGEVSVGGNQIALLATDGETCDGGTSCDHVAAVGGLHYDDLQSALDAAQSGEVTLLENVTVTSSVTISKNVTLNLNNHKISSSNFATIIVNDGVTTTVQNGTLSSMGKLTVANNGGNLTLRNCTVTTTNSDRAIQNDSEDTKNDAVLVLDNCTVTSSGGGIYDFGAGGTVTLRNNTSIDCIADGFAVYHNGSYAGFTLNASNSSIVSRDNEYCAVYVSASTTSTSRDGQNTISFTGCTVTGPTGIESKYTNVTLNNCNVTATAPMSFDLNNNGSTALGFAVVSTDNTMKPNSPKPDAQLIINGGNYNGAVGLSQLDGIENYPDFAEADYTVYGGQFTTDPTDYLADTVEAVVSNSSKTRFGVYTDIQDAADNARPGDTITVYKPGLTVEMDENSGVHFEIASGATMPTILPRSEEPEEEETYIPSTPISDGWHHYSSGSMYYQDGKRTRGWADIDGARYYFDEKGYMAAGWLELEDGWYYFAEDGKMDTGWLKFGNTWYYLDPETGRMYDNGLATIGKYTYYFYDWGGMANSWWYEDENGDWYFFGGDGAMKAAQWVEWKGEWYYLTESGKMAVSTEIGGYTVNADGVWVH